MAPPRDPAALRGRRLLAAIAAAACLLSTTALVGGTNTVSAATSATPAAVVKCRTALCPTPTPTPTPTPIDSPTPNCIFSPDFCPPSPSPSPVVIVVSPVAPDPSPSPTVPSYLTGINPSPTPTQQTTDSISSPVPLVGGFVDQLPTPSAAGNSASPNDLAPHSSGLQLPFLVVGALLILGAIGSLIYAIAPRNKAVFDTPRRAAPAPPVRFTSYGPEGPGSNIVTGPQGPRPRPKGRR
ncbi:MAG: hypothetical protein ACR2MY_13080 [Candidatus Dormibacteria bacterium]